MELKKRTLKFYCGSCDDSGLQIASLAEHILDSISPILDAKLKNVRDQTVTMITSLSKQVADLAASNKDLVGLFNPTSVKSSVRSSAAVQISGAMEPSAKRNDSVGQLHSSAASQVVSHSKTMISSRSSVGDAASETHRRNVIRGTVPTQLPAGGQNTFAAVVRRAHLYVGNVRPHVSKETVADYVREKVPNANFDIEELPKREEALSRAFKLSVDFSLLSTFNSPDFWPQDVMVKRFFHPKRKPQQWDGGQRDPSGRHTSE